MTATMEATATTATAIGDLDADAIAALGAADSDWLAAWRARGWDAFASGRLPTRKDEHWRFTNLRGLDLDSCSAASSARVDVAAPELPDGVTLLPLAEALEQHPELIEQHLGSLTQDLDTVDSYFAALQQATLADAMVLHVARNTVVSDPIDLGVWHTAEGGTVSWRLLVVLDEGAEATVIERFRSADGAEAGFSNAVVELVVGANARLNYTTTQQYARGVWHFATHRAAILRDGNLDWTVLGTGGRGGKSRMEVTVREAGANANLTGAYFIDGDQAIDYDTLQTHAAPNATSDLSFKGVLAGKAKSVWRGMIVVDKGAQGTDSYQDNRNLMLTDGAHADSIPGLQIEANEVRCTHGSTIGKLDPEQLFYLKARGLPEAEAMRMLVTAFFVPVLDRIQSEPVREDIRAALDARMDRAIADWQR